MKDAGIDKRFKVRNMKDVFVDIAETEGLTRAQMANMLSTREDTLARRYGADTNATASRRQLEKLALRRTGSALRRRSPRTRPLSREAGADAEEGRAEAQADGAPGWSSAQTHAGMSAVNPSECP